MEAAILCNGKVHYRRSLDKDVYEAMQTPGYSVFVAGSEIVKAGAKSDSSNLLAGIKRFL